jgi:hypothetical protein
MLITWAERDRRAELGTARGGALPTVLVPAQRTDEGVPLPCHNERATTVTSSHPRSVREGAGLGAPRSKASCGRDGKEGVVGSIPTEGSKRNREVLTSGNAGQFAFLGSSRSGEAVDDHSPSLRSESLIPPRRRARPAPPSAARSSAIS